VNRDYGVRKPTKTRKYLAALIVERVNTRAPEKIEGLDIVPVHNPVGNWGPGLIWPPVIKGGETEGIIFEVVSELVREFDIDA
jgi:hypothetical protein